jgi:hypothetical protein
MPWWELLAVRCHAGATAHVPRVGTRKLHDVLVDRKVPERRGRWRC